ncbi:MAG: UPF0102 protein [Chitinophagales bacterium]|nr:MAG: UPF0102 protein [Chitinophagales bacterium]
MADHNELGRKGEKLACNFLRKKGYEILATNYRFEKTEIDIICRYNKTLVFVEVKTRSGQEYGEPEESVEVKKQQKLVRAAENFVQTNDMIGEVRFDVIAVIIQDNREKIKHIKDAFYPYQE